MPKKRPRSTTTAVRILSRGGARAPRALTARWVSDIFKALANEKISASAKKRLRECREIFVVFVLNEEMHLLNKKYRGKNRPTDILSFEGVDDESLGELVIALDIVRLQAREHDLPFADELGYMLLHGVLHLLGYDHGRTMFGVQDRVFAELQGQR